MADRHISLAEAAASVGVATRRDIALCQDHAYRGLYSGGTARDIPARKGVKPGQILALVKADELAANLFRASQTEQKLRREPIQGKIQANQMHCDVGKVVRELIVGQGNPPLEQLPTPDVSIQALQRREQKRVEAERQPSL